MILLALARWLAFAIYLCLLFALPLGLLWGTAGAVSGISVGIVLLGLLRWRGSEKITRRLGLESIRRAQAPRIHALVDEYSRRLKIKRPKILLKNSLATNTAAYGFASDTPVVVITQGCLQLSDTNLAALIARLLIYLKHGQVSSETWLAQFLAILDPLTRPLGKLSDSESYPVGIFIRQLALYPLTLVPSFLLKTSRNALDLDYRSVQLLGDPRPLAEVLRIFEATKERNPFTVPFSTRHLFLIAPPCKDPLISAFFRNETLTNRIEAIESLSHIVALT